MVRKQSEKVRPEDGGRVFEALYTNQIFEALYTKALAGNNNYTRLKIEVISCTELLQ